MTTDPTPDRPRALHFLEAADFLRDAHFRDGLSVQEIDTALRLMADEADPMVGSLARDGLGLDEIAAMPVAVPDEALRDRVAEALYRHEWPGKQVWQQALAMDREVFEAQADAVLSVLPPDGRAGVLLWAADWFERDGHYVQQMFGHEVATELRRMAAGERDEQQAQQGGAETRDALMAAHTALAAHTGRQQAALTRIGQMADHWEQQLPEVIRTPAVVSAIRAALERADVAAATPVAEEPPADTGEEAACTCAAAGDCFAPAGHYVDCPQATPPAVVAEPGKETGPAIPCSWAATRYQHSPHDWNPQPGMDPVRCPGWSDEEPTP